MIRTFVDTLYPVAYSIRLVTTAVVLSMSSVSQAGGSEPTLARLSFWVPGEATRFEVDYRARVLPILQRHGLRASSRTARATPDSVFSRLFEFETPSELRRVWDILRQDAGWLKVMRRLATDRIVNEDGLIRHRFEIYTTPVGQGRIVNQTA